MSRTRGTLLSLVLVSAIGVGTGISIFQPAFKEEAEEKGKLGENNQSPSEPFSPPAEVQIRKTEESVANAGGATTIPRDTPRWAEVMRDRFPRTKNVFEWAEATIDDRNGRAP